MMRDAGASGVHLSKDTELPGRRRTFPTCLPFFEGSSHPFLVLHESE